METTTLTDLLKNIPLFAVLGESEISSLAENAQSVEFSPNETISNGCTDTVTVIIEGSAAVMKNELLMRMLSRGSVSGVASLYGENGEQVSVLRANTSVRAAFIQGKALRDLIHKSPSFAEAYIKFLTSRIKFLNNRIRAYTSGSAEAKLAFHILYSDDNDTGKVNLGVSMSSLADMLNIGRASLYRAFDALVARGAIARNGSTVEILDKKLLL